MYHSLRCRVWDYPIKEQYTSIYKVLVINNNKKHFQIQSHAYVMILTRREIRNNDDM